MAPPVIFIGDDFTGASDTLATFARAGWRARLFLRPPLPEQAKGLQAVGLATALRAMGPQEAAREIAGFWPALAALSPRIVHLKICSTFDSHPKTGSIGAAARVLERHFQPDILAVIGGQPSLGRYAAFGTLYARGPDGVVYRIDRHPVMRDHPVTPMHEADLTRHLAAQGLDQLHLVAMPQFDTLDSALNQQRAVFFDAVTQDHIARIGAALAQRGGRQLLIGASSVAEALSGGSAGNVEAAAAGAAPNDKVLVFAGSRSVLTRAQVSAASCYEAQIVTPAALDRSQSLEDAAVAAMGRGVPVLLHLDPDADYAMPPERLAALTSQMLVRIITRQPVGRLGVAGGDTSSRICAGLDLMAIDYLAPMAPGVGLCRAVQPGGPLDGMRLMLKGGQMGGVQLFDDFARLT